MTRPGCRQSGFTLIELVVVTALITLMLFIAIPRFQVLFSTDDARQAARWLMLKIPLLKDNALQEQKDYRLNFDFAEQVAWVSRDDMTEEELQAAVSSGYHPPGQVRWTDLEFGGGSKITADRAAIRFYRQGYSDKVIIHLQDDNDRQFSVLVEPFLSNVAFYDHYVNFDD